jgi:hypothetical protein
MMFASCEPAEDDPTPDPGTEQDANFVAFTFDGIDGAAEIDRDERTVSAQAKETVDLSDIVAEFTLSTGATATVDGTPQVSGTTANDFNDPVIYEVTSGDGETTLDWTVTIIKDMAVGKKYITYNKPVTAYYIEYNGGMVDANKNGDAGNYGNVIEAYSTGIKAEILWNDNDYVWDVDYHIPGLMYYGPYGTTTWTLHEEPDDDTFSTGYYEYPLGEFAAFVAEYKGTDTNHGHGLRLFDIATSDDMEMPDRLDVTEYYVRSEKVMDTLCDVYQAHDLTYEVDLTFWVDPDTGLTLKYKCEGRSEEEYEVTKLILDTPDWDELRLRPQDGDTIIEP